MTQPLIEWTEQALLQLDHAQDYISLANSEEVAARITAQIIASIEQLAAFPMSGRSGRVRGSREWSYRIRHSSPPTPSIVAAS